MRHGVSHAGRRRWRDGGVVFARGVARLAHGEKGPALHACGGERLGGGQLGRGVRNVHVVGITASWG